MRLSRNNQAYLKDKSSFAQSFAVVNSPFKARVSNEPENHPISLRPATTTARGYERRKPMPLIQVQVIKDVFSQEQKRQIISKLTDAMVSIEGENMRQVTFCLVEEVESGDWGIGGKAMTTADVHALARGKAA
jgi:4-oxalocrotonate tautomerase